MPIIYKKSVPTRVPVVYRKPKMTSNGLRVTTYAKPPALPPNAPGCCRDYYMTAFITNTDANRKQFWDCYYKSSCYM